MLGFVCFSIVWIYCVCDDFDLFGLFGVGDIGWYVGDLLGVGVDEVIVCSLVYLVFSIRLIIVVCCVFLMSLVFESCVVSSCAVVRFLGL